MKLEGQFERLFNPRAVAVIGASSSFGKWGFRLFKQALDKGGDRRIYPVNNEEQYVLGVKSYRSIKEVPEAVDLAVIVVPPQSIPQVVEECVESGVKFSVVVSAGFSESGEGGMQAEKEMVNIAKRGGMRLVGPNCMGLMDTATELLLLPFPFYTGRGQIGIVSQSGNLGLSIAQRGLEMGLGFSKLISTGNEADLHLEDFLEYLAQDEDTKVITAYIEGLREGRRFLALAKQITKHKPIVVMKGGITASGARASRSHTSALAGAEEIYDVAFKQTGVLKVESIAELLDVAGSLLRQPLPRGRRVGILTGGGGFGVIGADACEKLGLEVASLSPATMERLNAILPARWSHGNPVDMVGAVGASPSTVYSCLRAMVEDENVDAILSLSAIGAGPGLSAEVTPVWMAREEEEVSYLARAIEFMEPSQKPVIVSVVLVGAYWDSPVIEMLRQNGILIHPSPQRAAKVLAHLVSYSEYLRGR